MIFFCLKWFKFRALTWDTCDGLSYCLCQCSVPALMWYVAGDAESMRSAMMEHVSSSHFFLMLHTCIEIITYWYLFYCQRTCEMVHGFYMPTTSFWFPSFLMVDTYFQNVVNTCLVCWISILKMLQISFMVFVLTSSKNVPWPPFFSALIF
jgi:hypothetical protein